MFKKGKNIEKDNLHRDFDPNVGYYYYQIVNGQKLRISYDDLNHKSKKILLLENKKLLEDKNLFNQECDIYNKKQRFCFLRDIGYTPNSFEYLGIVNGTVSEKVQNFLSPLLSSNDSLLGIHRVGESFNQEVMEDIFSKGLKMTSHMNGAVVSEKILSDNVSYYDSNKTILKELMYANSYKNSVGSILIQIPDSELIKNEDILINVEGSLRLNPKYIVGYVPLYQNHHLENIINNPNYYENLNNNLKNL